MIRVGKVRGWIAVRVRLRLIDSGCMTTVAVRFVTKNERDETCHRQKAEELGHSRH